MNNIEREVVVKSSQNAKKELGYKALNNGNQKTAQDLLQNKKLINSPDNEGKTLLLHSILRGDSNVTRGLINLKAELNSEDRNGHTPLLSALGSGRYEQVEMLRENKAVIRIKNPKGVIKNCRLVTCSSSESEAPCDKDSEHSRVSTAASSSHRQEQPSKTTSIKAFATEDQLPSNQYNESIPPLSLNNINSINPLGVCTNHSSHNQPSQLCQALTTFRKFHTTTLTVDHNRPASCCLPNKEQIDDLPITQCSITNDNHEGVSLETFPENTGSATTLGSDKKNDSEQLADHENFNNMITSKVASFNAEHVGIENSSPTAVKKRYGCLPSFFFPSFMKKS